MKELMELFDEKKDNNILAVSTLCIFTVFDSL